MTDFQIIECVLLVVLLFLLIFDILGNRSPSNKANELTQEELTEKRIKSAAHKVLHAEGSSKKCKMARGSALGMREPKKNNQGEK